MSYQLTEGQLEELRILNTLDDEQASRRWRMSLNERHAMDLDRLDMSTTPKVYVIGDAMVDKWMTARADRRSAEADIDVWDIQSTRLQEGGAANVANALAKLGVDPEPLFIMGLGHVPVKTRIVVNGVQVARFDQHDHCYPHNFTDTLLKDGLVVLSDYGKGAINASIIDKVARNASEIWINTKFPQSVYGDLDMARPSTGRPTVFWVCNREEYAKDQEWYQRQLRVWVSKGPDGIEYWYDGKPWKAASKKACARSVVSVCGAGDVTLAMLVKARLRQCDPEYMAKWAMTAAAISVEHPFTYCPTLEEVETRFYG